jgi:hypothetical protein
MSSSSPVIRQVTLIGRPARLTARGSAGDFRRRCRARAGEAGARLLSQRLLIRRVVVELEVPRSGT